MRPTRGARPQQGDQRPGPRRRATQRRVAPATTRSIWSWPGRRRRTSMPSPRPSPESAGRWPEAPRPDPRAETSPTSTRHWTSSRCPRGPTRSGSSSSRRGPTPGPSSAAPHRRGRARRGRPARPRRPARPLRRRSPPRRRAPTGPRQYPAFARCLADSGLRPRLACGHTWDDRYATLVGRVREADRRGFCHARRPDQGTSPRPSTSAGILVPTAVVCVEQCRRLVPDAHEPGTGQRVDLRPGGSGPGRSGPGRFAAWTAWSRLELDRLDLVLLLEGRLDRPAGLAQVGRGETISRQGGDGGAGSPRRPQGVGGVVADEPVGVVEPVAERPGRPARRRKKPRA